ncbi:MAG TPA: AMP-binding protein, partial [Verrucomicrobiae bacterium]|nr:AMP-binding protein [Verrucomicrobiae bacterium]
MNLATAFAQSARKNTGKPAIFWGEEIITYDQVSQDAAAVAHELASKFQINAGEPVAIWLKNCP